MRLHPSLIRQLAKRSLNENQAPQLLEVWKDFLESVSNNYYQNEDRRSLLENALLISSEEMAEQFNSLQRSENYNEVIFESSIDGIITSTKNGKILECNLSASQIFGTTIENLLTKNIDELLPNNPILKKHKAETETEKENEIKSNSIINDESNSKVHNSQNIKVEMLGFSFENQKQFPVEVSIILIDVKNSQDVVYIWYIRDLRLQKEFESIIEKQRQELVVSSKLATLGEMAGGVAHEINTPLAIMKFSIDLIKMHITEDIPDTSYVLNKLEVLDKTVDRVTEIIKNLRNFSRDGSEEPFQDEKITELIKRTISLCNEKFKKHNIEFNVEYPEDENLKVFCSGIQISQVILNLLSNSFDAIENTTKPWIKLEARKEQIQNLDYLLIAITDSGSGIKPQIAEKMFNPFYTTKEIGKGTGMGLSMSLGLIQNHNGLLYYDSSIANTKFIIRLPLLGKKSDEQQ